MEKDINQEVKDIVTKVVQEGFTRTQEQMPYFTEMLLLWAKKNKYTDALTEFLACFVDAAVVGSIHYVTAGVNKAAAERKREIKKEARKAKEASDE